MFEMDDDFDLDEVMLDTVSIIEEEAIRATNSFKTDNTNNKNCNTQPSIQDNELLQQSLKCPVKRKSGDTESDINIKIQKRSSQDCLRLLESSIQPLSPPQSESPIVPNTVLENQRSKPPTGHTSGYGMRTIPTACQRKFPGPAGLLPERTNRMSSALNVSGGHLTSSQSEIPMYSQPTQTLDVGPWQALRCDLQDARDLLDKYTVSWVKQKVATRRLAGQKIPFLAAVLYNVDTSSPDPNIVLRDKTGFITGVIHRSVWECHGGQLVQGSALVLRLVGVACTGSATQQRFYVNVTSNNIVTIYSPSPDGDVNVTEVHPLDIEEMRQRVKEWEAKFKINAAAAANSPVQNSSLFSSVLDRLPLGQITPASPGHSNPARNIQLQRPTVSNALQTTVRNVPNQISASSKNSCGGVPKTSNFMSRVELPKTSNQINQNEVVTSTQTNDAGKMSLEVSSFLDGLDTDLLFDDF